MPITYKEGDIKLNPQTGQQEVLTPEGIWSAQALEQQVKGIQSEVQRLSKEATILDTSRLREEVIPGMKKKLTDLTGERQQVEAGQPVETITLYKNNQTAQVPAFDVANWVKKGWGGTQPTADGLGKDEKAAFGIEDTEETFEQKQAKRLNADISNIDKEIDNFNNTLSSLRVSISDQTQALINSIKQKYEVRRNEMKDVFTRQEASYRALNIRGGTERYVGQIASGIISEIESQRIQKLTELDAEETSLINSVQQNMADKQYDMAYKQFQSLESKRKEKADELQTLNKEIISRNYEIAKENKKLDQQGKIMDLIGQGIMNPNDIFNQLGGQVSLEDIDKAQDIILSSQKSFGEDKIDTFTDAEGNRILTFQNKNTGEIRNIKVGTEGIKKPASYEEWEMAGGSQTGMTYFQFLTRKDKETGGDGMSSNLLTAIMMNPQLFNTLTPSAQTDLIPGLSQMGFEFPKKVSAEQEKNLMSAYSGVESLDIIENALDSDPDIFKKIAITPFGLGWQDVRVARKNAADVITRLRTGAALNVVEMKEYENYIPIWQDTPESAKGKINFLRRFYKLFTDNAGDTFPIIKKKAAKNLEQGEILVQDKKTGELGAIKENEYNPNQYIKLTY